MKTMKKHKNTLIVWISIYPAISIFLILFGEPLNRLPVLLRTLILTMVLVPLMVYVLVPFWTRVFDHFENVAKKIHKHIVLEKMVFITILYMVVSIILMIASYGLIISGSDKNINIPSKTLEYSQNTTTEGKWNQSINDISNNIDLNNRKP